MVFYIGFTSMAKHPLESYTTAKICLKLATNSQQEILCQCSPSSNYPQGADCITPSFLKTSVLSSSLYIKSISTIENRRQSAQSYVWLQKTLLGHKKTAIHHFSAARQANIQNLRNGKNTHST